MTPMLPIKPITPLREDDRQRRIDARRKGLNGIDYVETGDDPHRINVYFFLDAPATLDASHCTIEGGVRVRGIHVLGVREADDEPPDDQCATLRVDRPGDFSIYTLVIAGVPGFDPHYTRCAFSFRAAEPKELDCVRDATMAPLALREPEIDYLSRDYTSLRQLLMNRLALVMPQWSETHEPDEGVALVEILAYVGDYLSYFQDAVATEAYLGTARLRVSVRRHARLVDYAMHEGCNSRTWICIDSEVDVPPFAPSACRFITDWHALLPDPDAVIEPRELADVPGDAYQSFSAVQTKPLTIRAAHSQISFYAWGATQYTLAAGATAATLVDGWHDEDAEASPGHEKPGAASTAGGVDAALNAAAERTERAESAKRRQSHASVRANGEANGHTNGPAGGHGSASGEAEKTNNLRRGKAEKAEKPAKPERPAANDASRRRKLAHLRPGDYLLIEEIRSPLTGETFDADAAHRQVVRLTRVEPSFDPLYEQPLVEVEWAPEDALGFALVVAAVGPPPACEYLGPVIGAAAPADIMVARANLWLVDHGSSVQEDIEDRVPAALVSQRCEDVGLATFALVEPGVFAPTLERTGLTLRVPPRAGVPASAALAQDPRSAVPQIRLTSIPGLPDGSGALFSFDDLHAPQALLARLKARDPATHALYDRFPRALRAALRKYDGKSPSASLVAMLESQLAALVVEWTARPELLSSSPDDYHYVVEINDDSAAQLRFGDGQTGIRPEAGSAFRVAYRIGNGTAGNVGAQTITHLAFTATTIVPGIRRVWNPLAATGGTDPESLDDVRTNAPAAFGDSIERAVTADDYAAIAARHDRVRRAAATLRWTGDRYAAVVSIAPYGSDDVPPALLGQVARFLDYYRRIGHDLEVRAATWVPLDIVLALDVAPDYLRGHVEAALLDAFGTGPARRAASGLFAPDNLGFGDDVHLSRIVATAQTVEGVVRVTVERFERMFVPSRDAIESGVLPLAPQEIARVDNDPDFPEHGRIRFRMRGGR